MRVLFSTFVTATLLSTAAFVMAQEAAQPPDPPRGEASKPTLFDRVVSNQKKNDQALLIYERLERLEIRKSQDGKPEIRISRAVPAGTGTDRIPVGPDGKPSEVAAYRAELEKLVRTLTWASEDGRAQHEAYEKVAKKQKEREELIEATRNALVYSFVGKEQLAGRMLSKYRIEPNPAYKPTSRSTSIFSKVHGFVWIDEAAGQLARVEGQVSDDISIGAFLAKVYKGSHFMQERWEIAPGLWFPTYSQYDFEGRKLFMNFGIHERTFYSQYRRIGLPKEALPTIRAELDKLNSTDSDP
jgi:hypothetical protein